MAIDPASAPPPPPPASPTAPARPKGWRGLRTRLWQRLVLAAMRGATGALGRLSPAAALRFGDALGALAYRVARKQRRVAEGNLSLAYPELAAPGGRARRDALTRAVFRHFARGLVDFLRSPRFASAADLPRQVACGPDPADPDGGDPDGGDPDGGDPDDTNADGGWHHVEAALARGKGVVLLTGHLGNWELLGRWLAARGVPLTAVAKAPADPALAAYVTALRESAGFSVRIKGDSARDLLRVLRRGEALLLLADQNSGDVFVPFFGVPAGTVAGPAALALATGAAVVPAFCVLRRGDHAPGNPPYRVFFLPPLDTAPSGGGSARERPADVRRIMTEANRVLESVVRRYPEQWLWLHNRWKSAFEGENRGEWPAARRADFDPDAPRRRV